MEATDPYGEASAPIAKVSTPLTDQLQRLDANLDRLGDRIGRASVTLDPILTPDHREQSPESEPDREAASSHRDRLDSLNRRFEQYVDALDALVDRAEV